jgi:CheY-like chemotaxis protein
MTMPPLSPPAPLRILVVDDNEDAAASLAGLLVLCGFHARYFLDPREALAAAAQFGPDACVLDLRMPGMDGFELARELRSTLGDRAMLVALTGEHGVGSDRRLTEAGFDRVFAKPANPSELLHVLSGAARTQPGA